jgi:hypothetical protein
MYFGNAAVAVIEVLAVNDSRGLIAAIHNF